MRRTNHIYDQIPVRKLELRKIITEEESEMHACI